MTVATTGTSRRWSAASTYGQDRSTLKDTLHIFVLSAFAVAQPLYDLLGRNAEFFVAHRSLRGDILTLVLLLSVALPGAIALVRAGVGLVSTRAGNALHALIGFCGITLIVLPVLNQMVPWPAWVVLLVACGLGLCGTAAYFRFAPVRSIASVMSPAALLFPAIFLFGTPVSRLVVPPENPRLGALSGTLDTPIVVVVFDELPLGHLVNAVGRIDGQRFPNFADLAETSHWFRNASAVSEFTVYGIPSILTGIYPPEDTRVPTVGDYPNNLFTLLAGTHSFNVVESITMLCPETSCAETSGRDASDRSRRLLVDVAMVLMNAILPQDFRGGLPTVTTTWADFVPEAVPADPDAWRQHAAGVSFDDRAKAFLGFVDGISGAGRSLNVIHTLIPHEPLSYTPSGRMYEPAPASGRVDAGDDLWHEDPGAIRTTLKRHLLQVQFADRLLGLVIKRLRDLGRFDEALVVVLADHGASFRPGELKRSLTDGNYPDIMSIPLFIKLPHQQHGVTSDRNVQAIDVLPTIADVIGVEIPWPVDGVSAVDWSAPESPSKIVVTTATKERLSFEGRLWERVLPGRSGPTERPEVSDELALYRVGAFADLIGSDAAGLTPDTGSWHGTVSLDQFEQLASVDLSSGYVPIYLTGSFRPAESPTAPPELAIVVNGRIAAIAHSFPDNDKRFRFEAILPEEVLVDGRNPFSVNVVLEGSEGEVALAPLEDETSSTGLSSALDWGDPGAVAIRQNTAASIPVVVEGIAGWAEQVVAHPTVLTFSGWAFDVVDRSPVSRVLLFVDGQEVYSSSRRVVRPDVAAALEDPAALGSGFSFSVPIGDLRRSEKPLVELMAVSWRGVASPLSYGDDNRDVLMSAVGHRDVYELVDGEQGVQLRRNGRELQAVETPGIAATIEESRVENDRLMVKGWAVDDVQRASPVELLVFSGANLVHAGGFWVPRPDVVGRFGRFPTLLHSGFSFDLPLRELSGTEGQPVRFIGRFRNGSLRELTFASAYRFETRP